MVYAGVVFFLALVGITGLFVLKQWEGKHARILFPEVRRRADIQALRIKALAHASSRGVEKELWPYLLLLARRIVRGAAIAFGHLAHWIGERSHALADLVSHKHRFERGAPRSEFLKKIDDYPIRNRNGMNGMNGVTPVISHVPREGNDFNSSLASVSTQKTEQSVTEEAPKVDPAANSSEESENALVNQKQRGGKGRVKAGIARIRGGRKKKSTTETGKSDTENKG